MSFRFRKSVQIAPGVRLNVNKKSLGVRVGGRGGGVTLNTSGRHTATASLPGTGLSYSSRVSRRGRNAPTTPRSTPAPARPGVLASAAEKAYARAVDAFRNGSVSEAAELFRQSADSDGASKGASDDLLAGLLTAPADPARAIPYLESAVQDSRPLPDPWMAKYLGPASIEISITPTVTAEVDADRLAGALALAECYQRAGRLSEAIGVMQQLANLDHPVVTLSLAELLAHEGAWSEIVVVTAGTRNEDDATLQTKLIQAAALTQTGHPDASLEVLNDCLRARKRHPTLLNEARYMRGKLHRDAGRGAQARKDFARVYADNPHFRDVAALVDATQ